MMPFGEEDARGILEWMHAWAVFMVACDKLEDAAVRDAAVAATMPGFDLNLLEEVKAWMDRIAEMLKPVEREWMRKKLSTEEFMVLLRLLRRAEAAAYGIWDMVHDIHIQANNKGAAPPPNMVARTMLPHPVLTAGKASNDNEMSKINEKLMKICQMLDAFLSTTSFLSDADDDYDALACHKLLHEHWVDPRQIVGRDGDAQRILDLLLSSPAPARGGGSDSSNRHREEGPVFLPIIGLAGVGKTALAQLIFSHAKCRDYYDARVWAYYVTNHFHLRVACGPSESFEGPLDMDSMDSVMHKFYESLGAGKMVLVVLDMICDQGNHVELADSLKGMLDAGNQGIKVTVIVVTRDEDVARRICTNTMVQPYKLHPLSDYLCQQIIKQTSDKPYLEQEIGRDIATRCGGIPMVARKVGSMLCGHTSTNEGRSFIDSSWHHLHQEVMFSLIPSYQSMPADMRLCFAHLAVSFSRLDMDDIIHGWMARGFIKPWDGSSTGYQRGKEIFSRLLDISFLQPARSASTGGKCVISFTIHGLVHSFARFVLSSRLVSLDGGNQISSGTCLGRYAVTDGFYIKPSELFCIRSLSFKCGYCTVLPPSICQLKSLRYLNLSYCSSLQQLPESFGSLINVVHINLSGCGRLEILPESFGNLINVVHINLSGCKWLQNLPESFGNLINVVHIDLSGCEGLQILPESFGNLRNVKHVNLSGCKRIGNLPESFGNLINVDHINLSGCSWLDNLPESFGNLIKVEHINLSGCEGVENLPESFGNLINAEHINLSGCEELENLPESLFSNLINVKHVNLSGCIRLDKLPESLCRHNKLEYLDLSFCSCFRELPTALAALTNLRHLNLSHPRCNVVKHTSHVVQLNEVWAKLTKLEYLNLSMFMDPTFCYQQAQGESFTWLQCIQCLSSLEHLDLSHDISLVDLPESLGDLSRLHTLDVTGCTRLEMRTAEKLAEMGRLKILVLTEPQRIEANEESNIGMSAVEGMLGTAVFVVARDRFVDAVRDAAVPRDMELEDMMGRISTVLEHVMRQPWMEDQWRLSSLQQKVKAAAYKIWDMVDEIQIQKGNNKGGAARMAWMLPCPFVAPKKASKMMSKVKDDLMEISGELESFQFTAKIAHTEILSFPWFVTEQFVGRDEDVGRILGLLLSSPARGGGSREEGPVFLPIFGLAGVGKTALVKALYNHDKCRQHYDARVWARVSENFDVWRICGEILSQLMRHGYGDGMNDMQSVKGRLAEVLGGGGHKVLVVVDGIWEHQLVQFQNLRGVLGRACNQGQGGRSKVTVLVTTCDEGVAGTICTNTTVQPYKLHPLSHDLCWKIIRGQTSRVFANHMSDCKQQLEEIGRKIAAMCGGIPLAAQEVGNKLCHKQSTRDWQEFRDTWQGQDFPVAYLYSMFSSLSGSYQSMPPDMRLCFSHLATSPPKMMGHKDDIIRKWIAMGFLKPSHGSSTGPRHGGEIIKKLLDISFLQFADSASDDSTAGSFAMHDFVHDLARAVSSGISIFLDGRDSFQQLSGNDSYRHARLTNCDSLLHLSRILRSQRVFLFHGRSNKLLSDLSLSSAKCLRVLDLLDCSLEKLPDSICQLRQLRHLNLSGSSRLVELPSSFGNLSNLGHIDLSGCSGLLELPPSFHRLKNVVHVNLSGCSGLFELPASFHRLKNVVHVNLSGCVGLKTLPESFGQLEKLEHLDLSSCSCLKGIRTALGGLTNLRHLNLSHPCCCLAEHRFHLYVLKDVWEKFKSLRYLNLSMCLNPILCYKKEEEGTKYIESISCLTNLEHLDLSHNIFLFNIPKSLGEKLSQLQTLNLSGCVRLERIDKWMGDKKSLVVTNCPGLQRYEFVVCTDGGAGSRIRSNLSELKDVSYKEVEISCLEKVISTEEAQSIKLSEKKKLQKLTLVWSCKEADDVSDVYLEDDDLLVDEESCEEDNDVSLKDNVLLTNLEPPKNLQCFELHGYRSESLPCWLRSSIVSHFLPNLVEITMVDIKSCSSLPPFGVLPNLQRLVLRRVGKVTRIMDTGDLSIRGSSNATAFHQLKHVTLDGMVNLEEIAVFPTLDELVVKGCPKLRWSEGSPPKARMLVISGCHQLMLAAEERSEHEGPSTSTTSAAPVTKVEIESCKVPLDESKWSLLQGLDPLDSLYLRDCSEKTISEEIMKGPLLSQLRLLCFSDCGTMAYLPDHVVQETSPQELVIRECCGIKSLPKRISEKNRGHYPILRIRGCPELRKWCESEENKKSLDHVQLNCHESGTGKAEITTHGEQRQIQPTRSFAATAKQTETSTTTPEDV